MAYVVKYCGRVIESWEFAPEGESFECSAERARERFAFLIEAGREARYIYGIVPVHVRIEDLDAPKPPSAPLDAATLALGVAPMRNVVLAQYVDDEAPVGPWAEARAAA